MPIINMLYDEHSLAAVAVTRDSEENAAQGTREKTGRKCAECEQTGDDWIVGAEECLVENQHSAGTKQKEIIPFQCGADGCRNHKIQAFHSFLQVFCFCISFFLALKSSAGSFGYSARTNFFPLAREQQLIIRVFAARSDELNTLSR
jgi:hypothetical protein